MPEIKGVTILDEQGVCNHCRNHEQIIYKGEAELFKLFNTIRNPDNKYDCIVNISGGRDSSYTLLTLVKDYKMKVVAVNYANPFTDEQAKKNIKNMVKILGVDFIQFNLPNNIHERILKNNIQAWFKNPQPAMVPVICIGCKIIWPTILKIAKENKIKCIINGGNPYEYTSFKKELLGISDKSNLNKTYFSNSFGLAKNALKNLSYLKPQYLKHTLYGYLLGNQYALGSRLLAGNIKRIDLFHYIPWDEKIVLSRIQNELDWDYPKNLNSSWRFDCQIAHLKDYMYLKSIGVTEKDDFYSKMIREGQITREEAISRIQQENNLPMDIIQNLFKQLNINSINLKK